MPPLRRNTHLRYWSRFARALAGEPDCAELSRQPAHVTTMSVVVPPISVASLCVQASEPVHLHRRGIREINGLTLGGGEGESPRRASLRHWDRFRCRLRTPGRRTGGRRIDTGKAISKPRHVLAGGILWNSLMRSVGVQRVLHWSAEITDSFDVLRCSVRVHYGVSCTLHYEHGSNRSRIA